MPRPAPLPHEVVLMNRIDNLQRQMRRNRNKDPPLVDLVLKEEIERLQAVLKELREMRN